MRSGRAGYEVESSGGIFKQLLRTAPLIVPVTMNSILTGEDVANAMDLRCFGQGPRTWLTKLRYHWRDYAADRFQHPYMGDGSCNCLLVRGGKLLGSGLVVKSGRRMTDILTARALRLGLFTCYECCPGKISPASIATLR